MPFYQFLCPKHGEYSTQLSIHGNLDTNDCPDCGSLSGRVYHAPTIKFPAGEGFAGSVQEKDMYNRYVLPDGSMTRKGSRDYYAAERDRLGK